MKFYETKNGKIILIVVASVLVVSLAVGGIFLFGGKDKTDNDTSSDTSNTSSDETVEVEDIEDTSSNTSDDDNYLEPDETEADKILEQHKNNSSTNKTTDTPKEPLKIPAETTNTQSSSSTTSNKPSSSTTTTGSPPSSSATTGTSASGNQTLEDTAAAYLKEHNIDPKTAGETGELCPHCSKKIWDPAKYGFLIPGYLDNYETSGYCYGTCGIVLE